jgi:hypothetical protein
MKIGSVLAATLFAVTSFPARSSRSRRRNRGEGLTLPLFYLLESTL